MSLAPPVPLSELAGGVEGFLDCFHASQIAASIAQSRLQETLEDIGPPGSWASDPAAATLQLRGRTFAAEMLGTFDGANWLWAWGNPYMKLPHEVTAISRGARDGVGTPAFVTPFLDLEGIAGPHHMAMQVVGHGFGGAYYIAQMGAQHAAFAIRESELAPRWPKIYELQRAITNVMATGLTNGIAAISRAADYLGLSADRTTGLLLVRDGDDVLTVTLAGDRVDKVDASVKL